MRSLKHIPLLILAISVALTCRGQDEGQRSVADFASQLRSPDRDQRRDAAFLLVGASHEVSRSFGHRVMYRILALGDRYDGLLECLGRLRPWVLGLGLSQPENAALFKSLVDSPLGEALAENGLRRPKTWDSSARIWSFPWSWGAPGGCRIASSA